MNGTARVDVPWRDVLVIKMCPRATAITPCVLCAARIYVAVCDEAVLPHMQLVWTLGGRWVVVKSGERLWWSAAVYVTVPARMR